MGLCSCWICAREIGYEIALLTHRDGHDSLGRRFAQQLPALSDDLGFDLVSSSIGIDGIAPPRHRVTRMESVDDSRRGWQG